MDKTDSTILSILKENSRASASDISKQVSLSVPAVTERIRKLEQTGVIEKYTIRVNPGASGYNLLAFILVKWIIPGIWRLFRMSACSFPRCWNAIIPRGLRIFY